VPVTNISPRVFDCQHIFYKYVFHWELFTFVYYQVTCFFNDYPKLKVRECNVDHPRKPEGDGNARPKPEWAGCELIVEAVRF
jgi:hypothetical protein